MLSSLTHPLESLTQLSSLGVAIKLIMAVRISWMRPGICFLVCITNKAEIFSSFPSTASSFSLKVGRIVFTVLENSSHALRDGGRERSLKSWLSILIYLSQFSSPESYSAHSYLYPTLTSEPCNFLHRYSPLRCLFTRWCHEWQPRLQPVSSLSHFVFFSLH